jgi:hypothetical protein
VELDPMNLVCAQPGQLLRVHHGAAEQLAQMAEDLPRVDLLRGAVSGLCVSGELQHRRHPLLEGAKNAPENRSGGWRRGERQGDRPQRSLLNAAGIT